MATKIYVGNLPFNASEEDIRGLFARFGEVASVNLINDRETGRPRGFGFVEMSSGAGEAIDALNETDFGGRTLPVSEAQPRDGGGGGGGGRGGRGGGGGGGFGGGRGGGGGGGGGFGGGGGRGNFGGERGY